MENAPQSTAQGNRENKGIATLADLLMNSGLHDNRLIAETVAGADYMADALDLALALERVREPPGAQMEAVTVALCAAPGCVWK